MIFLGAGKEQPEILGCGVDLGSVNETLEQHPAVFLPGLDFRIRGQP